MKLLDMNLYDKQHEGVLVMKENIDGVEHSHSFVEIVCFESSGGIHRVNGIDHKINKGDIYIIDKFVSHSYRKERETDAENASVYNILIMPEFLYKNANPDNDFLPTMQALLFNRLLVIGENNEPLRFLCFRNNAGQKYFAFFQKMLDEYHRREIGYISSIHALLIQLTIFLFRDYIKEKEIHLGDIQKKIVFDTMEYIQEHYKEQIVINELAMSMYISPQYLNKLFNACVNDSVGGYIQRLRIKEAERLLQETDWSIRVIMEEVGYYDRKFFNKTFKKLKGVFPKEYREEKDF